jgi:hypothetical protein
MSEFAAVITRSRSYSSGLLARDPATPSPGAVRVRFGAAGTYR